MLIYIIFRNEGLVVSIISRLVSNKRYVYFYWREFMLERFLGFSFSPPHICGSVRAFFFG